MTPVVPPRRMVRWPFSAGWTALMIVVPLFWPILGVVLLAEVFCLALWLVLFVAANTMMLAAVVVHAAAVGVARRHHSA